MNGLDQVSVRPAELPVFDEETIKIRAAKLRELAGVVSNLSWRLDHALHMVRMAGTPEAKATALETLRQVAKTVEQERALLRLA